MIFTLYYMYSTFLQWWRLGTLRNKLRGTLNGNNALLVCAGNAISEPENQRSLENLLYHDKDKFACTVVPRQRFNLKNWLAFPKNSKYFPIHFSSHHVKLVEPKLYIMVRTLLEKYYPHQADVIDIEKFGELMAWRVNEYLEIILKTDMDNVTKLVHCLSHGDLDINHELKILKIETVDIEGIVSRITYERVFPVEQRLKYSLVEPHWTKFVDNLKELYTRLYDKQTNPKITIENGAKHNKLPISEVKPIKKEQKRDLEVTSDDKKDTLEVHNRKRDVKPKIKPETARSKSKEDKKPDDKRTSHRTHRQDDEKHSKSTKCQTQKSEDTDGNDTKQQERRHKKRAGTLKKMNSVHDDDGVAIKTNDLLANNDAPLHEANLKFPTAKKMSRKNSNTKRDTKPPNVLVYADSVVAKENVKMVLGEILHSQKYTIYDLPTNKPAEFWDESTTLVVICGNVTPNLTYELLQYLVNGGQLLCLCSDLLYSVLQTFTTAEVREHELVRFSYGDWKRVKMMHHIFCYQASPAKKQFSKDSDQSNQSGGEGSSPIAAPRTPSAVEITHNGNNYTVQVQVLGTEETWQTPSLLLANVKGTDGRAIFSQVHLEVDPTQYQDDENKYEALKDSNQARLEIMRHILTTHLDIDCTNNNNEVTYSPAYFLGRHDMKLQLLKENENISENRLVGDKLTLVFCWKNDEPGSANISRLPVMVLSCPSNFSTVQYFESLKTEALGRLVIYSDTMSSSQHVLSGKLVHGLAVIPRRQTQGIGRSNNVWLSPPGCAMFSLQLHIPLKSALGKSLPLVQHLVMVGIVSAIRSKPGYEDLEINLKWPNDLYTYSKIKIGGLVVNSQLFKETAIVNIGCGVNLSNSNPTICINDVIAKHNEEHNLNLPIIPYEVYFAMVFNEVERILKVVQDGRMEHFYDLYYKYWLHRDSEIVVRTEDNQSRKVRIMGVDEYGYLSVKSDDGTMSSVQPDGNTFNMLKGLIAPKIL